MTDNFDKSALRIMLLDDEPFMLKLLARLLQSLGYAALSSHTSGDEALVAVSDGRDR